MALPNYPNNPQVDDTFLVGDKTFQWDGEKWKSLSPDSFYNRPLSTYDSTLDLENTEPKVEGQRAENAERSNAQYVLASEDYTAKVGDITAKNNRVWKLLTTSVFNVLHFGVGNEGLTDVTSLVYEIVQRAIEEAVSCVLFPKGVYKMSSVFDGDRDNLPSGFVPDLENRRANKCIIIYEAEGLTLKGENATIDRSDDSVADPDYAEYSSTIYVSKSNGVTIEGFRFLGSQNNTNLLNDIKSATSGDHIVVNSGSSDVKINSCYFKDGTNPISIGVNRTSSSQTIDPALEPVTDVNLSNIVVNNFEHGLFLGDCERVSVNNYFHSVDGVGGVSQRGLFLHSCREASISNYFTSGAFKTVGMFRNYKGLENIKINSFFGEGLAEYIVENSRGSNYSSDEGVGFRFECDNCDGISITNFTLKMVTQGINYTDTGTNNVSLSNGVIDSVSSGFSTTDYSTDAVNFSAITNLTLRDLVFTVQQDLTNFPDRSPVQGIVMSKGGSFDHKGLVIDNVKVKSQNRNARIYDCGEQCKITNSEFSQILGLSGARVYDLHVAGNVFVNNCTMGNRGIFNDGADAPALSDTGNVVGIVGYDGASGYALYKYDGSAGTWSLV